MTPAEKVAHGLELAAEGFDDLRRERTDLAQRLALNRAAIVGGEQRALSLRFEAMRDRQDRSLSGTLPARLRLRDGLRVEAPTIERETQHSLDLYVPTRATRMPSAPRVSILARLSALFLAALLCAGCGVAPLDAARLSLGATVAVYQAAEPRLEAERAAAGQACLDAPAPPAPCLADVRAKWAPIRAASERAYRAIVAALALLHLTEAGAALGQGVDVAKLARAVSLAVDAAGAFQAALAVPVVESKP